MKQEVFEKLLKELDSNSLETLTKKNAKYAAGADRLHNFKAGADILGSTTATACWGYLTKHLVALRDMVERNDFHDRDDFLEKCQDSINYIRFLWCIGNEEMEKYTREATTSDDSNGGYNYEVIFFDSRSEAYEVLDAMKKLIAEDGFVSVADMYEITLVKPSAYDDTKYGWRNLTDSGIISFAGGKHAIRFPKLEVLK